MADHVHIRYVRTGGIGGLRMVADVDTATLASEQGARFLQLAEAALREPAPAPAKRARPDGFSYQLTIGARSLSAAEPIASVPLRQLIEALDELAQPGGQTAR